MKVEQFRVKNQFRIFGENKNILQSYNSTVVVLENDKIILGRNWDYSTTTIKYVYEFLEEFTSISFWNISNKREYIRKLIENGTIIYDEKLV